MTNPTLCLSDVLAEPFTSYTFDVDTKAGRYTVTSATIVATHGNTVFYGVYRSSLVWLPQQMRRSTLIGLDMLEVVRADDALADSAVLLDIALRFATPDAPAFDWSLCVVKERAA